MHTFNYIKRKRIAQKLGAQGKKKKVELTAEETDFLKSVQENPGMSITAVYKEAGLSPRKGNELRKKLEEADVIEIIEEKTAKGWSKHIKVNYTGELTEKLQYAK